MEQEKLKEGLTPLVEKCERYLRDKEELSEEDIKSKLIEPMFRLLGWDFEDEKQIKEQKNQPSGRPDYIFYDKGRIAFFLEAKKLKEITDKDIKQAYNYAFSKSKRWAVLTNFQETYILICDNKGKTLQDHIYKHLTYLGYQSYLNDLSLISLESFSKELIDERARVDGRLKKQIKIDEELLEDITSWRKKLTASIRANNTKEYDKPALDEIVQTILDRIIFMRTVEDRKKEAVKDDTISSLIHEYWKNDSINLKAKLDNMFEAYDRVYNSKLFTYDEKDTKRRHECENVKIDNKILNQVLKGTYEKGETIEYNFANIDADVLGSMYENYLGYIQERRKEQGIYYTPTYIVDYIVKNTVGEILKNKKPKDADKIKVLDSACGSGSFLIKAFDYFNDYYKKTDPESYKQKRLSQTESVTKRREDLILEYNLFGVDLDEKAIEIAKLNLLLKAMEDEFVNPHRLPNLKNLNIGNSLIDDENIEKDKAFKWENNFSEIIKLGGFDVIIGNPPYIQLSMEPSINESTKSYLLNRFKSSMGRLNTFGFFIKLGIDLVKEDGLMGFIIPNTILTQDYYEELREMILNSCKIEYIVNFADLPFKDAVVENVILILRKCSAQNERERNKVIIVGVDEHLTFKNRSQILQSSFLETNKKGFTISLDKTASPLRKKIEKDTVPLGQLFEINQAIALKHEREKYLSKAKVNSTYKKVLDGRYINRYNLAWDGTYLRYDITAIHSCKREDIFLSNEKLFFRRVGRNLAATLDAEQFYALNTIVVMNKKPNVALDIRYFLGIFNSKLINYYYQSFLKSTKRVFSEIQARQIKNLPMRIVNEEESNKIIILVNKLLSLNKELQEIGNENTSKTSKIRDELEKTDAEIDKIIYKLYDLTDAEIKFIEASVRN